MLNHSLKVFSILVLIFFFESKCFSQTLTVSSSQLNFGITYENAPDSLPLTIFNSLGHTVNVTGIKFYNTYGSPAFSIDASNLSIPASSSQQVWVKFSPHHNIFHNSEMVIENDALRGFVSVDLTGQGKYSISYYDSTENLSEENLKTTIHTITGIGYDTLGYNFARDSMFMWLDNQMVNGQGALQNTIEGVYTGIIASPYINRTDCQTTFSFNTEHTFPQGFFGSAEPMKSDLHHLFPTDDASNNYRSNNPFGVVTNPAWSSGGSLGTTTLFEPRDQQKGATARAMMYFVLRYQDYNNFFSPQESILRTWHHNFPPTQIEKKRNNDINIIQHNRNPFVDYPQFIDRITSISNFSTAPVLPSIDLTEDTIIYGFVQASMPVDFHYVIVNNGNTTVHFTNFNLSNTGILNFQLGGNDTAIAPGDAIGIDIRLIASGQNSIHENLSFHTDVPSQSVVTIPIYANDSLISGIHTIDDETISVFPNPATNLVNIFFENNLSGTYKLSLTDFPGRELYASVKPDGKTFSLDLNSIKSGIYILRFENITTGKIFYKQIVKL